MTLLFILGFGTGRPVKHVTDSENSSRVSVGRVTTTRRKGTSSSDACTRGSDHHIPHVDGARENSLGHKATLTVHDSPRYKLPASRTATKRSITEHCGRVLLPEVEHALAAITESEVERRRLVPRSDSRVADTVTPDHTEEPLHSFGRTVANCYRGRMQTVTRRT